MHTCLKIKETRESVNRTIEDMDFLFFFILIIMQNKKMMMLRKHLLLNEVQYDKMLQNFMDRSLFDHIE